MDEGQIKAAQVARVQKNPERFRLSPLEIEIGIDPVVPDVSILKSGLLLQRSTAKALVVDFPPRRKNVRKGQLHPAP